MIRVQQNGTTAQAPLALVRLATLGTPGANVPVVRGDYVGRSLAPLPDGTVYKTGLAGFEQVDEIAIVVAPDYHEIDDTYEDLIPH